MTKQELLSKIKDGEIRAAVENYIAQAENTDSLNEQVAKLQNEKAALQVELETIQKNTAEGITEIHEAVLDPETDTEKAVLEIIARRTKNERQKQVDSIDQQIATLQKQKEALDDPTLAPVETVSTGG